MVSWLMTIKAVLISSGVATVILFLKHSVPAAIDFAVSRAPIMWISLLTWLKPPYLYVITNGIIVTIFASSRFYRSSSHRDGEEDDRIVYGGDGGRDYQIQRNPILYRGGRGGDKIQTDSIHHDGEEDDGIVYGGDGEEDDRIQRNPIIRDEEENDAIVYRNIRGGDGGDYKIHRDEEDDGIVYGGDGDGGDYKIPADPIFRNPVSPRIMMVAAAKSEVVTAGVYDEAAAAEEEKVEEEVKRVIVAENSDLLKYGVVLPANSNLSARMIESENLPPLEKPLVSSRFGNRKRVKSGLEGKRALRVTKPKGNETLENTWKMITEGKSTPALTKNLYRRSDTFTRRDSGDSKPAVYKKSETFRDRTNYYQSQAAAAAAKGKMKKEPSLSQEELNRRVEAFIKKFNEEMKLQRLESLRQYKDSTGV